MLERMLRAASLSALGALALRFWVGAPGAAAPAIVATPSLDSALASWTWAAPPRVTVHAMSTPGVAQRDWLVALRRAGTLVHWVTADSAGGALVVEATGSPRGATQLSALGTPRSSLSITDELGLIDSTTTGASGVAIWRASPIGTVRTAIGASLATAQVRDSVVTRPVLVVGMAGWETKFVTAALEEAGWSVTTRVRVAPAALVRQGAAGAVDTATLSALVVLDSTSELDAGAVARFVADGGGLVASGAGARHPALRALLPRAGRPSGGAVGGLLGPEPRLGLDARTFVVGNRAVALERRGDSPVVVGRRVGAGRVVAVGYDDTWRVRMMPPDETAPAVHRDWWSSLVAGVAHARLWPRAAGNVDEAPLASTVEALGAPLRVGQVPPDERHWPWDRLLAIVAGLALVGEWLSRRLRGVA